MAAVDDVGRVDGVVGGDVDDDAVGCGGALACQLRFAPVSSRGSLDRGFEGVGSELKDGGFGGGAVIQHT